MSTQDVPAAVASSGTSLARGNGIYYALFFVSGFPALLYQIVWQRALFTIYGVNIQSVTIIVTVFLLGLGFGSLGGGWLSKRERLPVLPVFGAIESGIALYGALSLRLFHAAASRTADVSEFQTGLVTFALLFVPTLLMGCTLPLLAAHIVRRNRNVGESVGLLYAVNTFGSSAASFAAAYFLMRTAGESGSVRVAAILNSCVAVAALLLFGRSRREAFVSDPEKRPRTSGVALAFPAGMLLASGAGFIALGYEMVWYRLYSFASGRSAASFALLLGWYLAGVAYGSLQVRDRCRGRLRDDAPALLRAGGQVILLATFAAFLAAPALAIAVVHVPLELVYPLIFVGAALLGATFPLISHAAIDPDRADSGARVSYLYLANIIGCASGSYLVGFVAMDRLSTTGVSFILLAMGLTMGCGLLAAAGKPVFTVRRCFGMAAAAALVWLSLPVYGRLYERLLSKGKFAADMKFQHLVENRSGVIAVTQDNIVYGGGVYDGRINIDLVGDENGLFRALALDALHPSPREVLMIGLSTGAWAQVIANNPRVEKITIIEINPGYLQIIPQHPEVAGLLRNPKVTLVIDDGRRWLVRNPGARFDAIVMNTSQHWLAHTSNLLSAEFLRLVRAHLKPGGIHYYNTTFSVEALLTGATIFPYALRVGNFLAVSDSPIEFNRERWKNTLAGYRIEGKPVFDMANPTDRSAFEELLALADTIHDPNIKDGMHLESGESLRERFRGARLVTDDNMATEWR